MKKLCLLVLMLSFVSFSRSQGKLGLGIYLGAPTGLTGKYLLSPSNSVDVLLAWRFNDAFFAQGHYNFKISELEKYRNGTFNFYAGPGLFFRASAKKDDSFGVSGNLGLNYFLKEKYEFFFEISPKVGIFPETGFDLTGGIGFRFYF